MKAMWSKLRRPTRWFAAAIVSIVTFMAFLWLFHMASFAWLPHNEADRWVVAAGFATAGSAGVTACACWWAGREDGLEPHENSLPTSLQLNQRARASGRSRITQVAGNQYNVVGRHDVLR